MRAVKHSNMLLIPRPWMAFVYLWAFVGALYTAMRWNDAVAIPVFLLVVAFLVGFLYHTFKSVSFSVRKSRRYTPPLAFDHRSAPAE